MRFEQDDLVLKDTELFDRFGRVGLEDLPDPEPRNATRLGSGATPMMQRLWKIALSDIESNIVQHESGSYFGAGDHFGLRVYTRDICLSGVLGLNV